MNECTTARAHLALYLDDELRNGERDEFLRHIAECFACRDMLAREREFLTEIRGSHRESAPASLRERVEAILGEPSEPLLAPPVLRQRVGRILGRVPTDARRRRHAAVAALVAVTFVGAMAWYLVPVRRVARSSSAFAKMAVDVHQRHVRGELPLEIGSQSPSEVSAWFAGKVRFGLSLPNYQETSGQDRLYYLLGARLVGFENDYAAYIAYRMGDRPISLVVTSDSVALPSGGQEIMSRGLTFHFEVRNGLKVITWTDRGLTYALVSDLEERGQQSCVVCHEGTQDRDFFETLRPER